MTNLYEIDKINYDKLVYYNTAFRQSMKKLNDLIHSFSYSEDAQGLFNQLINEVNKQSCQMKQAISNIISDDLKSKNSVMEFVKETGTHLEEARDLLTKTKEAIGK